VQWLHSGRAIDIFYWDRGFKSSHCKAQGNKYICTCIIEWQSFEKCKCLFHKESCHEFIICAISKRFGWWKFHNWDINKKQREKEKEYGEKIIVWNFFPSRGILESSVSPRDGFKKSPGLCWLRFPTQRSKKTCFSAFAVTKM
jgi:hypothetical protein